MDKILGKIHIFFKLTTSIILFIILIVLGYFFYLSYQKQEEIFTNNSVNEDKIRKEINDQLTKLKSIEDKIKLNENVLIEIQKEISLLSNIKTKKENNDKIDIIIEKFNENFIKLNDEIFKLKNQIQDNSNSNQITSVKKNGNEIIDLVIYKYENNINFDKEIEILENIYSQKDKYLFEKIRILTQKSFNGQIALGATFQEEMEKYIKIKIEKKSNNFLRRIILPYVNIQPSNINLEDEELVNLTKVSLLIKNYENKKALQYLEMINNFRNNFEKTTSQLERYIEFKNSLEELI
tara:strand:- start:685 stop:1566 length:882 start_codon:yes stop_codon:yes gene_type:complete